MPAAVSACSRSRGAPSPAMTQSGAWRALCCQFASERQPQHGVEYDAHRRTLRHSRQATGEQRIIREHRADAGEHGVVHRPHEMHVCGGSFAGYPCGLASRQRDLSIRRDRKLERDVGAAILNAPDVTGMRPPRLLRADADFDHDAGFRHAPMAGTRDLGIGVDQRRNHARDAGRDDRVGARGRLAVMRAGFERHVQRGAAGRVAGTRERLGLGVGAPARLRPAAPDDEHRP